MTCTVYTLLGASQVDVARQCLPTFLDCCQSDVSLVVLSDGTLSQEQQSCLKRDMPTLTCIEKKERDPEIEAALNGYSMCLEFRRKNPLAQKLFDPLILAGSGLCHFVDSDVLFVRSFKGFPVSSIGSPPMFMMDEQSAYSISPLAYGWGRGPRLPARVNTGLYSIDCGLLRLDLVEAVLKDDFASFTTGPRKMWAEQTLFAMLAARSSVHLFQNSQCCIASPLMAREIPPEVVAIHFVSPMRYLLAQVISQVRLPGHSTSCTLKSSPASHLGRIEYFAERVRKKVRSFFDSTGA